MTRGKTTREMFLEVLKEKEEEGTRKEDMWKHTGWVGKQRGAKWKNTVVPLICGFAVHSFTYLPPAEVQKHQVKTPRKKQPVNFKLHTILHSMIISHPVLLHPTQDVGHLLVRHLRVVYIPYPVVTEVIRSTVTVPQGLCSSHPRLSY